MTAPAGGADDAGAPEPIVSPAFHRLYAPCVRPLFGYLRVPTGTPESDVQRMRDELAAYAVIERFELISTFMDYGHGRTIAFRALVKALLAGQANYVVVPALDHFAQIPCVQVGMKELLEKHTGAYVLVVHRGKASA